MEGESERKEERGVRNRMRGGRETERPDHQVLTVYSSEPLDSFCVSYQRQTLLYRWMVFHFMLFHIFLELGLQTPIQFPPKLDEAIDSHIYLLSRGQY